MMCRSSAVLLLLACMCGLITSKKLDRSEHVSQLSEANNRFCIKLYKTLIENEEDPMKNMMFSPLSISAAMAMTHLGAKGDTAKQIDDTFMFSKIEDKKFHSAFGELHSLLFEKVSDNVTLKSSNRVFANNKLPVLEDYKNALTVYGAKVEKVDFGGNARELINKWANESTEGKIPSLLGEDDVNAGTALLIANTVFFKGDWHSMFREYQTENRDFYVTHYKVVRTPFMFQKGQFRFGYVEELTLQIVEIDYAGKEFSMFVLLPENFDLVSVEKELNHENLTRWLSNLKYKTVDLTLPKFKIEETLYLHQILPKMGVTDVFSTNKSDLSGIASQTPGLFVDQVIHKAVIEVDEKGGKVDAERAEASRADISDRVTVYADHPFIIVIRSKASNTFHFMGAYKRPEGRIRSHDEL
ncbi:leukocyte elastase inhibitor A-like isoform X2 [Clavelina lepadiformis]|uniref:leukocyte elastase inhibitor A-like isoform X2 n=1 Tax=Clavelina lepadiformis TaxID=159417 RepID=UPI0040418984